MYSCKARHLTNSDLAPITCHIHFHHCICSGKDVVDVLLCVLLWKRVIQNTLEIWYETKIRKQYSLDLVQKYMRSVFVVNHSCVLWMIYKELPILVCMHGAKKSSISNTRKCVGWCDDIDIQITHWFLAKRVSFPIVPFSRLILANGGSTGVQEIEEQHPCG